LLEGRPEFDSRLGTTERSFPLRRWREASVNVLYECDWMIVLYECYKINKKSGILPPNFKKFGEIITKL
jgi:hypothetical protein